MERRILSGRAMALVLALGALLPAQAVVAQEIRTEQVRFGPGQNGATITGAITGYKSVSYKVGAEAGQTMSVALDASNLATYFNVYAPGSGPGDAALATGQLTGPIVPDINHFSGTLPASGDYTINVFMMRSAARRGERSDYSLEIAVTGATGPVVQGDFADGLQGGPDYWAVAGLTPGDTLNLRAGPSTGHAVLGRLPEGTGLRNFGCRMAEGQRWCEVETLGGAPRRGWVAGTYLAEGGPPAAGAGPAEPFTRAERVRFPTGAMGTVLAGRLNGGDAVDYRLGARAGQILTLRLAPGDPDTRFNVFSPDGGMLYESVEGGPDGDRYRGQLAASGDHTVTVYHTGPGSADYRIEVTIE